MNEYQKCLEKFGEYGVIEEIRHPIGIASGLPNVKLNEIVISETNQPGQILSIKKKSVEILLFSKQPIEIGSQIARTGKAFSIKIGQNILGQVVDPLGKRLAGLDHSTKRGHEEKEEREIDTHPLSIMGRARVKKPLLTGVAIVDTLLPLGKGQKELVVGDRKTGKTSFLLSAAKSQIEAGSIVVYALIGKKTTSLNDLLEFAKQEDFLEKITIVASTAHDPLSLIYITPFTAMTIAEYYRDSGKNVLLILDDLSTHAQIYREISLLGKRFPGRDSYPSDMFHTHARLLERAGNFRLQEENKKDASITCLPVAETIRNDLTDYIVSNLIGITDGHILFDADEFEKGRRPAINPTLSVTRVGKQTQKLLYQEINRKLMVFISVYKKSLGFAQFGAELNEETKSVLDTGEKLYSFFDQAPDVIIPIDLQVVFIAMIWLKFFQDISIPIYQSRDKLIEKYNQDDKIREMLAELVKTDSFDLLLNNVKEKGGELLDLCDLQMKSTKK